MLTVALSKELLTRLVLTRTLTLLKIRFRAATANSAAVRSKGTWLEVAFPKKLLSLDILLMYVLARPRPRTARSNGEMWH